LREKQKSKRAQGLLLIRSVNCGVAHFYGRVFSYEQWMIMCLLFVLGKLWLWACWV